MPTATRGRTISRQLRDAIRDSPLSVGALGRLADVDDGVIHRFLSEDRSLTLTTTDRIAEALGLKPVEPGAGRARKRRD